jgi:hypothetical protein
VNSRTNTMQSMRNHVGDRVRNMTHHGQPNIEINLNGSDGPRNTWVTSYSTMDSIEGTVTITTTHDALFEDIDVAFIGEWRSLVYCTLVHTIE